MDEKKFEIVVCSRDRSEEAFQASFPSDAPWLAIPFDSPERDATFGTYKVPGIPSLTIVDADGGVIALEGDNEIGKGMDAFDGWKAAAEKATSRS
mmetsp:Transcript_29476/g.47414  ORF Transcript_29476/g.47414 Transcript_29476/m.47414 type:complete len:95 (+) Transcript_29476:236-520(+)|eukprot:CAMPEP_0169161322 /NCGR_PEP_ID=MMETSP1015-20121227/56973_1 /TAXON_ID=342587 /ORGANISM="Karlodinium micrum, Strain CCMP2283" /LENGTH=94 /DNA_ID=CAMNT_0009233151 /DNA_START=107 /DNA_END=391 /DNA_ORIENTATION=+